MIAMFAQSRDTTVLVKLEEEFSRPVETIMRCEDFKSNFARRLSNRYSSRSTVSSPNQDTSLKLRPLDNGNVEDLSESVPDNASDKFDLGSTLSQNMEQNNEAAKSPDKSSLKNSDIRRTEVTALKMEVETLRWQLAQTEANRQMHIALLKQIVAFLNRVKEHIESQNTMPESKKETLSARMLPRSFNLADLPRSRSVLHVNKNIDYSINHSKKISTKKISKSISDVNGYNDCSSIWSQSKLSLTPETDNTKKITEEMSRLIILTNTVLKTKLPDLACTCNNESNNDEAKHVKLTTSTDKNEPLKVNIAKTAVTLVNEDIFGEDIIDGAVDNGIIIGFVATEDTNLSNFICSPLTLNDSVGDKQHDDEQNDFSAFNGSDTSIGRKFKPAVDKRNEYNSSTFIEDESGFSSMSSFQEIGIPIISIIPPSPCKEIGFLEDIPDILEESEKWNTDTMELDKQSVKVFWV